MSHLWPSVVKTSASMRPSFTHVHSRAAAIIAPWHLHTRLSVCDGTGLLPACRPLKPRRTRSDILCYYAHAQEHCASLHQHEPRCAATDVPSGRVVVPPLRMHLQPRCALPDPLPRAYADNASSAASA